MVMMEILMVKMKMTLNHQRREPLRVKKGQFSKFSIDIILEVLAD